MNSQSTPAWELRGLTIWNVGETALSVATINRHHNDAQANAHMACAAPTMLKALHAARAFIEDQYACSESQALQGEYLSQVAREVFATIIEAIVSAEPAGK